MSAGAQERFEPWAWGAFAVAGATAGLFLFLGTRPGGPAPVLAYRFGLLVVGWASAVGMLAALAWSLRRRPVLQRKRAWPLSALAASLWFCSLPLPYPSSHEGKFSPTRFRLPFEGTARVRHGGELKEQNHLVFDPARRFGLGFEGRDGGGLRVLAPAQGVVLRREPGRNGERLVLVTGESEYCVLEGLEPGSSVLDSGAEVEPGEFLGHAPTLLVVHLQDEPEPERGEGVPMRFWGYLANGRAAEAGVPMPPQEVVNATPGTIGAAGGR